MSDIEVTALPRAEGADAVSIVLDGHIVAGWEDVTVTLSAEAFPNSFALSMSLQDEVVALAHAGASCRVRLGDDLVISGYVDRVVTSIAPSDHTISLVGRGKTCDLVDCSAEWPSGQLTDVDALAIAQTLVLPYEALAAELGPGASAGPQVPQWNLNYGESGAAIVQRVALNAGLLAYESAEGVLTLATVGSTTAASGVVYGGNLQAASIMSSMDGRYSDVVCCSEAVNLLEDVPGSDFYHRERDPNVKRHRQLDLVLEAVAEDPEEFTIRKAIWEVARRAGRSAIIRATVDSWRDSAGKLWTPNSLIPVKIPGNAAGSPLVLAEVTFHRSDQTGTTADLILMPKAAFALEPVNLQPLAAADVPAVRQ